MNTKKIHVKFAELNKNIKVNFGVAHHISTPSIPEGYLKPEGVLDITEDGSYDVAKYETVAVKLKIPKEYGLVTYNQDKIITIT